jgi:AraC-like DNA-binding protein
VTNVEHCQDCQKPVLFQRRTDFPGVELRRLVSGGADWGFYSSEFEFLCSDGWAGEVWHRQHRARMEPGSVLAAQPGEVYLASQVQVPGALQSLVIDSKVLAEYLREYGVGPEQIYLHAVSPTTPLFASAFADLCAALGPSSSVTQVHECMVRFTRALLESLVDAGPRPTVRHDWSCRAAERLRECLHDDCSSNLDLSTLAAQTGLSRFQALRAFKRHYGLPPHAYQLRVRVGIAQRSLREGRQPARVAAECGFVDQSHMTRHFKRLVGVTPAQYQRLGTSSARAAQAS